MKAAVALLVAVAALALAATVVQAGFYFTAEDLKSDEALWELYGRWAAHHEAVRQLERFPAFKANAHMLHGKQRHAGELMALNVFGDQTFDEFMATSSCCRESPSELEEVPVIDLELLGDQTFDEFMATSSCCRESPSELRRYSSSTSSSSPPPGKVDWRSENAVTDVKS